MTIYTLYRLFDKDLNLLYVGSSMFFQHRVYGHRSNSWFKNVEYVTLKHYRSKTKMLQAEVQAIQSEHPIYNLKSVKAESDMDKKLLSLKVITESRNKCKLIARKPKDK